MRFFNVASLYLTASDCDCLGITCANTCIATDLKYCSPSTQDETMHTHEELKNKSG